MTDETGLRTMRERIKKFIKDELLDLVDAVVDYKYYSGPELDLDLITEKNKGLEEIINSVPGNDYEEWEEYKQARFIILNVIRTYKEKDV